MPVELRYCRSRTPWAPYGAVNFSATVGTFFRKMSSAANEPLPEVAVQRTITRIVVAPTGTRADPEESIHVFGALFELMLGYAEAVEIRPFVEL